MSKIFEEDSEDELERYERQQISRGTMSSIAYGSEKSDAEDSGEDSTEELDRWEREQLNRAIDTKHIDRFQDEYNATSLYNRGYSSGVNEQQSNQHNTESFEEVDMEIEIQEQSLLKPNARIYGETPSVSVIFQTILSKVNMQIEAKKKHLDVLRDNLKKIEEVLHHNEESMTQLKVKNSKLFLEYESLHKKEEEEKRDCYAVFRCLAYQTKTVHIKFLRKCDRRGLFCNHSFRIGKLMRKAKFS